MRFIPLLLIAALSGCATQPSDSDKLLSELMMCTDAEQVKIKEAALEIKKSCALAMAEEPKLFDAESTCGISQLMIWINDRPTTNSWKPGLCNKLANLDGVVPRLYPNIPK